MKAIRRTRLIWSRVNSLAAAVVAVLAAMGTLFAHHRSVSALSEENRAIIAQGRAVDSYNAYEAKEIRYTIYQALIAGGVIRDGIALQRVKAVAADERRSSPAMLAESEALDQQAKDSEAHGEMLMRSYETLQLATTFFEIAIVFVSIATLAEVQYLLPAGVVLSGIGLVFFATGLLQSR
ncbi:MAG TPA: DUF4337 family protein [Candidatus Cybelea sp.]